MTTLKIVTIAAGLLVGSASLAMAQNGPATGGVRQKCPPAASRRRWSGCKSETSLRVHDCGQQGLAWPYDWRRVVRVKAVSYHDEVLGFRTELKPQSALTLAMSA